MRGSYFLLALIVMAAPSACSRSEKLESAPAADASTTQQAKPPSAPAAVTNAGANVKLRSPVEGALAEGTPVADPKTETRISGLQVMDAMIGKGAEATPGNRVFIHYTGWLEDGRMFDSSRNRGGAPLEFRLGAKQVVPGFEEGVAGMRVGGRRRIVIPAHLGYGERGAGNGLIPPNANLIFELELIDVK